MNPQIHTVAELNNLPRGTAFRDRDGYLWEVYGTTDGPTLKFLNLRGALAEAGDIHTPVTLLVPLTEVAKMRSIALHDAADAAVDDNDGIPWDDDHDRATVASWLRELAENEGASEVIDLTRVPLAKNHLLVSLEVVRESDAGNPMEGEKPYDYVAVRGFEIVADTLDDVHVALAYFDIEGGDFFADGTSGLESQLLAKYESAAVGWADQQRAKSDDIVLDYGVPKELFDV